MAIYVPIMNNLAGGAPENGAVSVTLKGEIKT